MLDHVIFGLIVQVTKCMVAVYFVNAEPSRTLTTGTTVTPAVIALIAILGLIFLAVAILLLVGSLVLLREKVRSKVTPSIFKGTDHFVINNMDPLHPLGSVPI